MPAKGAAKKKGKVDCATGVTTANGDKTIVGDLGMDYFWTTMDAKARTGGRQASSQSKCGHMLQKLLQDKDKVAMERRGQAVTGEHS